MHFHVFRLEMAGLAQFPVTKEDTLKTTTNTGYEIIGEEGRLEDYYDLVSTPPGGPPPDIDEKYDIPSLPAPISPSHHPL